MKAASSRQLLRRWQSTGSASPVLVENMGTVRMVTLNNPRALNALNSEMIHLMKPAISEGPSAIVLQGAGEKAFCAGGDVVSVVKASKQDRTDPTNVSRTFFRDEYQLDYRIATIKTPVIAYMNGITMGGGVGISINAPIRLATSSTMFAMPEAAIGFFPDVGGSYFLPRLPGNFGRYLALTGARVKGKDTVRMGLATHYVHSQKIEAQGGLGKSLNQNKEIKLFLASVEDTTTGGEEGEVFSHREALDNVFSAATVEDILIGAEREAAKGGARAVVFQAAVKGIKAASPLSLKVILEQLRRGATMNLREVFKMEYRMSQHFMEKSDFYEGVRALLIDKDKQYHWNPPSLAQVSDGMVHSYFAPLQGIPELEL
eukprot:gb/GEZN01009045.1/.p1 GENE.gb/GEZN01009045.1/~~gb/GEZN01009045.1/.p1  ORF type:complete len:373 (+),score=36.25 gb/GEZN01009045.1/:87-1205(+)